MGPISSQCMLYPIKMCMVPENWSLKLLVCFCSGEEAKLRRKLYSVDYWDCRDSAPYWVCPVISSVQNIIEFPLVVDLFLLGAFSLFFCWLVHVLAHPLLFIPCRNNRGWLGKKRVLLPFFLRNCCHVGKRGLSCFFLADDQTSLLTSSWGLFRGL